MLYWPVMHMDSIGFSSVYVCKTIDKRDLWTETGTFFLSMVKLTSFPGIPLRPGKPGGPVGPGSPFGP